MKMEFLFVSNLLQPDAFVKDETRRLDVVTGIHICKRSLSISIIELVADWTWLVDWHLPTDHTWSLTHLECSVVCFWDGDFPSLKFFSLFIK